MSTIINQTSTWFADIVRLTNARIIIIIIIISMEWVTVAQKHNARQSDEHTDVVPGWEMIEVRRKTALEKIAWMVGV